MICDGRRGTPFLPSASCPFAKRIIPNLSSTPRNLAAFLSGGVIGALGGLIGLGGAEFRLPVLITLFRFGALEAVILNKAMSLIVVATALPFLDMMKTRMVEIAAE